MKIKYVHFSEPNKTQIYDTKVALKKNSFIKMSQEEFDEFELSNMESDRQQGNILSYEIVDEDEVEEILR